MGSHKEWRKIAKKERRKRIRKQNAKKRCAQEEADELAKQNDEHYKIWMEEQKKLEAFQLLETNRIHEEENEKWMRVEIIAQMQWRQLQEKIAKARFERAQQDLLIKKEWEEQQNKIKAAEESRKQKEEEQLRCHEELMKRIEEFANGIGELPNELRVTTETNPNKDVCPFYSKIGICRFGDNCSRNHQKPGVSKVLVAKNFYLHFGIEHSGPNEYDTDILLEYDDKDNYKHFKEFFDDVLPEFKKLGKIVQFKVCCNFEKHLRGNTYIEYESLHDAVKAYRQFHGRWYGGKQISLQFCNVPSWKQAICGLFAGKRCPKGRACNFLHVFKNPGDQYSDFSSRRNAEVEHRPHRNARSSRSWSRCGENGHRWRWSESPEAREKSVMSENRKSKDSFDSDNSKKAKNKESNTPKSYSSNRSRDTDENTKRRKEISQRSSRSKDKDRNKKKKRKKSRSSSRSKDKDKKIRNHHSKEETLKNDT